MQADYHHSQIELVGPLISEVLFKNMNIMVGLRQIVKQMNHVKMMRLTIEDLI